MKILICAIAMLCASCATITPQQAALIASFEQSLITVALTGQGGYSTSACSLLSTVQPTGLAPCAVPVTNDPATLQSALLACATQTALAIEFFKLQQKLCPVKS
jgi:hypothetical protein